MKNWLGHYRGIGVLLLICVGCGKKQHEVVGPQPYSQAVPVASPSPSPVSDTQNPPPPPLPVDAPSEPATVPPPSGTPPQPGYPAVAIPSLPNTLPVAPPTLAQAPQGPGPLAGAPNLFVVISGNDTCEPRKDSRVLPGLWSTQFFDQFMGQIAARGVVGPNDELIFVCYQSFSADMFFWDSKTQPQMIPIHEAELDGLILSRAQNIRKIIMLGYSYGGWRTMKLASSPLLLAKTKAPILLITVDPISRVTCQGAFDKGCHSPPTDFVPEELNALNTRTRWLNTFQMRSLFVNSGPIPAAHDNIEVKRSHLKMARNPAVWSNILGFLSENL